MSKTPLSRSNIHGHFLFAAIFLGTTLSTLALTRIAPALTNAAWSANHFQFTLLGETNVAYILESSSDLRIWTPALTNSESEATRTVTVSAASAQTFWRVRPLPSPLFEHAIVARGSVAFKGSGRIDTFNSTNAAESTAGQYDPAKATDRASVVTTLRTPNAISVDSMSIYGSVATGPGASVTVGANGRVGSTAYNSNPANAGTIEPGRHRDDFQVALPTPYLPRDFAPLPLTAATVGGTNFMYAILTDGDYRHTGHLSIGSGQKMLINARCRIHVLGNTTLSGGYILLGADAYVEWYCGGRVDLQGQGVINQTESARNFSIIALTSQPISYGGQAKLIGTIYAPHSVVSLSGTADAIGGIISSNFTLSGNMGIHFDESLKGAGPFR